MSPGALALSIVFFGSLTSGMIAFAAGDEPRIRVHVTDTFGNSLPVPRITLTVDGVTATVPQDVVIGGKYGRYSVAVRVPGFSDAKESVVVDQPEQVITVAMRLGAMEAPVPRCSVGGLLVPESVAVRIRLMELFGFYVTDVPVMPGGAFEFRNLECGDYMLIMMGPNGCVGTKITRAGVTPGRLAINIDSSTSDACTSMK
jgi:hypothetical protein